MEPANIPCVSAQWTHEAAREGRPVSELPGGMNGGPRGKDLTQGGPDCLRIANGLHGMTSGSLLSSAASLIPSAITTKVRTSLLQSTNEVLLAA